MTFEYFTNLPLDKKISALNGLFKGDIKFDVDTGNPLEDLFKGFGN